MGPTFYEIAQIGQGRLAVMAKPVAGEWVDDEFAGLFDAGIRRVVSLLEEPEAFEVGLANEDELCTKHGLEFAAFPIVDRGLPASVEMFARFTKGTHDDISRGLNTVIHCRAGIGRTGIVAAGVLLHAGFGVDKAFSLVSQGRGVGVPDTDEQREWLLENQREIQGLE